jgi:hypothetical protein
MTCEIVIMQSTVNKEIDLSIAQPAWLRCADKRAKSVENPSVLFSVIQSVSPF